MSCSVSPLEGASTQGGEKYRVYFSPPCVIYLYIYIYITFKYLFQGSFYLERLLVSLQVLKGKQSVFFAVVLLLAIILSIGSHVTDFIIPS